MKESDKKRQSSEDFYDEKVQPILDVFGKDLLKIWEKQDKEKLEKKLWGGVAQLIRAPACHAGDLRV